MLLNALYYELSDTPFIQQLIPSLPLSFLMSFHQSLHLSFHLSVPRFLPLFVPLSFPLSRLSIPPHIPISQDNIISQLYVPHTGLIAIQRVAHSCYHLCIFSDVLFFSKKGQLELSTLNRLRIFHGYVFFVCLPKKRYSDHGLISDIDDHRE